MPIIDTNNLPDKVFRILKSAGWNPTRDVSHSIPSLDGFQIFPAAKDVLREFLGLKFGKVGTGVDCATSDIEIDPFAASHFDIELREKYERELKTTLFPLGEYHNSHGCIIIDKEGRIYKLIEGELVPFASCFQKAITHILLGTKPNMSRT